MDFCYTSLLMDLSRLQWFDAAREELGWSESTTTELIKTFGLGSTIELIILAVRLDPRVGERIRQRRPSKTTSWFLIRLMLTTLPQQIQETETQLTKAFLLPESSATISGPEISVESPASPSSHTIIPTNAVAAVFSCMLSRCVFDDVCTCSLAVCVSRFWIFQSAAPDYLLAVCSLASSEIGWFPKKLRCHSRGPHRRPRLPLCLLPATQS